MNETVPPQQQVGGGGGMMMSHHQFCLKWNNHSNNLLKVFGRLFSNESFTDVTLAAEGRSIRAHKMVLSACSTYFEQLFLEHLEANPIVIMRETSFNDLVIIVEFMYKGEINVSQDQLGSLLRTAESLRVKGLAQATAGNGESSSPHLEPATTSSPQQHHQQQQQQQQPLAALLPLFQNCISAISSPAMDCSTLSGGGQAEDAAASGGIKRKRMRWSKMESIPAAVHQPEFSNCSADGSRPPSSALTPHMLQRTEAKEEEQEPTEEPEEATVPEEEEEEEEVSSAGAALDLRLTDAPPSMHLHELGARLRLQQQQQQPHQQSHQQPHQQQQQQQHQQTHQQPHQPQQQQQHQQPHQQHNNFQQQQQQQQPVDPVDPLRKVQLDKSEPHCYFRGYAVYKFNDYIAHGTRQQYWEEQFTKAVMEGIQDRELDLKKGAELLGVSYSTLYGRYRESHGYLRHAWTRVRDRGPAGAVGAPTSGDWWESDPHDMNERNGACPAEELVVEVDSYDVMGSHDDVIMLPASAAGERKVNQSPGKESLVLSIRHGKVQRKLIQQAASSKELQLIQQQHQHHQQQHQQHQRQQLHD